MPTITFLSDYGLADDFVGVCHGVIARIAPAATVVDITHDIPRHDVRAGALVLARTLPFMPAGVHLAVVDPGVGGTRRAIAVRCAVDDHMLVGPDNGLLLPAAAALGGAIEAIDVSGSPHRLRPVSATFHGRDVFAPVAAHLAAGVSLAGAGDPLAVDELVDLTLSRAHRDGATVIAHAIAVDRYGNVMLDADHELLAGSGLRVGHAASVNGVDVPFGRTFSDVAPGTALLYEDAYRALALAVNRGSAAQRLGLAVGDEVRVTSAEGSAA